MSDVAGKSVLVVGASGGLGALLAQGLADAGARLTLAGRSAQRLQSLGVDDAQLVSADLLHPHAPASIVSVALDAHGGLDGVVYAAGVVASVGLLTSTTKWSTSC